MKLSAYVTSSTQTKAYRLLREHIAGVLKGFGLAPTSWSMLSIIAGSRDGIRQVEVAHSLHVKAPLVTALAQELQQKGYIKSVPNQFDARAKLLAVTPAGRKYAGTVGAALDKQLDELLQGLSEADLTVYHKVLTAIIDNAAAMKTRTGS